MPKCEHGLTSKECYVCASPKHGAEPVQEPYCHVYEYDSVFGLHREFYPRGYNGRKPDRALPLYTAPPQPEPLTDEEIDALFHAWNSNCYGDPVKSHRRFARAVERKVRGEKE